MINTEILKQLIEKHLDELNAKGQLHPSTEVFAYRLFADIVEGSTAPAIDSTDIDKELDKLLKTEKTERKYKSLIKCRICKRDVPRTAPRQTICTDRECAVEQARQHNELQNARRANDVSLLKKLRKKYGIEESARTYGAAKCELCGDKFEKRQSFQATCTKCAQKRHALVRAFTDAKRANNDAKLTELLNKHPFLKKWA